MLDHVFRSVSNTERSVAFYTEAPAPLSITHAVDYDGKDGPEGHPDLKGFGSNGRVHFWLREGPRRCTVDPCRLRREKRSLSERLLRRRNSSGRHR